MIYPAEVFTGESGDPGALAVVEVRKVLADTAAVAAERDRALMVKGAEAMREHILGHGEWPDDGDWVRTLPLPAVIAALGGTDAP